MIEQTRGLDSLSRPLSRRSLNTEGSNLYDLCALLLTEQCERILRAGILADYVEEEDALPVLRGRLLVDRQLRQRFGQIDKVICRYDEHHQNIRENQILAFALDFCGRRVHHPSIAATETPGQFGIHGFWAPVQVVCEPTRTHVHPRMLCATALP